MMLFVILSLFIPKAQADTADSSMIVAQRVSAFVDGQECHWGLIRRTNVTIVGNTIELECRGFIITHGYVRHLNELENISWQRGLFRGRILATDVHGAAFWISVPKAHLPSMKRALKDRL
jgi:hypothetical protein